MKKKLIRIISFTIPFLIPVFIFSATPDLSIGITNPIKSSSVSAVLTSFFDILIQIGAVMVTLAIVYAGFLFVAAKGNPEELNKAKTTLFWTIIGSLVLLGAQVIANIIDKTVEQL